MEYLLTTEGLQKKYRHFTALHDVSMHIPKGAIYGFVGRNGSGKTTLIRLICGLQTPTAGSYTLFGKPYTHKHIQKCRKRMGAVVEQPAVYPSMTARENLVSQYRILGIPSFDGIGALLELVGLEDTGRKKAGDFSLGMRQRLGIAIALAGNPDFLVLDEPANGLDPQGIVELRELILRLNRERQITMLISSHILDELSRLATHYGFLDKGCLLQEISAAELEAACRKCLCLTVSDTRLLCAALDEKRLEYRVLSDAVVELYSPIGREGAAGFANLTELVQTLAERGCTILSVHEREAGLENHYMNLVGRSGPDRTERSGK